MDSATLLSKLNKAVPDSVSEIKRFGKTEVLMPIVDLRQVSKLAAFLKKNPDLALSWLENFSVVHSSEPESILVFSYFVSSPDGSSRIVLRGEIKLPSPDARVDCPSVQAVWPMAEPMEREIAEFFGVRFLKESGDPIDMGLGKLPAGWKGYPLRKTYKFPEEVGSIRHERKMASMAERVKGSAPAEAKA